MGLGEATGLKESWAVGSKLYLHIKHHASALVICLLEEVWGDRLKDIVRGHFSTTETQSSCFVIDVSSKHAPCPKSDFISKSPSYHD